MTVGYVRVSTEEQATVGISLESQRLKLSAWGELMENPVHEVIEDAGWSAGTLKRPGMERLMTLVKAGRVACLVVNKLDRLTRDLRDLSELMDLFERRRVQFVSITESWDSKTAAGRMVIGMLGVVAEFERGRASERTLEVKGMQRRRGDKIGREAPYGKQSEPDPPGRDPGTGRRARPIRLVDNPAEQEIIAAVRALKAEGKSLREIAVALNAQGLRTRSGGEWRFQYVANILKGAE